MSDKIQTGVSRYVAAIRGSGLTLYDPIAVGDPALWIPAPELQALLDAGLRGLSLVGLPLRTRSKVIKENICKVLGYPIPKAFRQSQPRFPGQMFDVYAQKSNNLQVWNESLSALRRYVLIRISDADSIVRVKVVTGETLALLDTTGTLTRKYQASCVPGMQATQLIATSDTSVLTRFVTPAVVLGHGVTPVSQPKIGELLPITKIFQKLSTLVGRSFADLGCDQERNRGAALHRLVCTALGYTLFRDDGQFPDLRHQLLEVKLQTSSTIDLGLVRPGSTAPLDVPMMQGTHIRHCDVRYAIFYARISENIVTITHVFLTTGEAFISRFPQFQGNVLNAKLQISLPANFFNT